MGLAAILEKDDAVVSTLNKKTLLTQNNNGPTKRIHEMKKASTFTNLHYQPRVIRVAPKAVAKENAEAKPK